MFAAHPEYQRRRKCVDEADGQVGRVGVIGRFSFFGGGDNVRVAASHHAFCKPMGLCLSAGVASQFLQIAVQFLIVAQALSCG